MATEDQKDGEVEQLSNRIMDLWEDYLFVHKAFIIRNNKKLNGITRMTMIGMVVMMIAMVMLVGTFTARMDSITGYMRQMAGDMQTMHADFQDVTQRIDSVQDAVAKMDTYVEAMPGMAST